MLQVENIGYTFHTATKKRHILDNVSLHVTPGEVYGFLGINGAGKSTLMRAIVGLLHPTTGHITIGGQPPSSARHLFGYASDSSRYPGYLTGYEFCMLFGALHKVPSDTCRKRARVYLTQMGIEEAQDRPMYTYSKGMKQRTALAASRIHNPAIVLRDEPMSGLDPLGRLCVKRVIDELRDNNVAVFFATHILADVQDIADRFAILHNKTIIHEGGVDTITGRLEDFFVEKVAS